MARPTRVEAVRKGKGWQFRIMRNRTTVHKDKRVYGTKDEAQTVGRNYKLHYI